MIIAHYYAGLRRRRVKTFLEPVYGTGPDMIAKVARDNRADPLLSTGLQPGELALYVNYPGRENYNFDAQGSPSPGSPPGAASPSILWRTPRAAMTFSISNAPSRPNSFGSAITSFRLNGASPWPRRQG
jgi:hypothetical protein